MDTNYTEAEAEIPKRNAEVVFKNIQCHRAAFTALLLTADHYVKICTLNNLVTNHHLTGGQVASSQLKEHFFFIYLFFTITAFNCVFAHIYHNY